MEYLKMKESFFMRSLFRGIKRVHLCSRSSVFGVRIGVKRNGVTKDAFVNNTIRHGHSKKTERKWMKYRIVQGVTND